MCLMTTRVLYIVCTRVLIKRLRVAYACDERVGFESLKVLPLDVIELIGKHITIRVVLHGLIRRRALPLSEGFLSE